MEKSVYFENSLFQEDFNYDMYVNGERNRKHCFEVEMIKEDDWIHHSPICQNFCFDKLIGSKFSKMFNTKNQFKFIDPIDQRNKPQQCNDIISPAQILKLDAIIECNNTLAWASTLPKCDKIVEDSCFDKSVWKEQALNSLSQTKVHGSNLKLTDSSQDIEGLEDMNYSSIDEKSWSDESSYSDFTLTLKSYNNSFYLFSNIQNYREKDQYLDNDNQKEEAKEKN